MHPRQITIKSPQKGRPACCIVQVESADGKKLVSFNCPNSLDAMAFLVALQDHVQDIRYTRNSEHGLDRERLERLEQLQGQQVGKTE